MTLSLPTAVASYFAAANEFRAGDAAACFATDALVHDESHDHAGRAAIRDWVEETGRKYEPKTEVLEAKAEGDKVIVTGKVSGNFPGSPVELTYAFTLRDAEIVRLEID